MKNETKEKRNLRDLKSLSKESKERFNLDSMERAKNFLIIVSLSKEIAYFLDQEKEGFNTNIDGVDYGLEVILPGIKRKERLCVYMRMLMKAVDKFAENKWPFDQGCQREWIWGSLFELAIEHEEELLPYYLEDEESTKDLTIVPLREILCLKTGIEREESGEIISMMDCDDYLSVCSIFYPHAIDKKVRKWSKEDFFMVESEFNFALEAFIEFKSVPIQHKDNCKIVTKNKPKVKNNESTQIKKISKPKSLYLMKDDHLGCYKIGISVNPKHREKTLSAQKPSIKLVGEWKSLGIFEKSWHRHFNVQRIRGEWFNLTKTQVAFFVSKCNSKQPPPSKELIK